MERSRRFTFFSSLSPLLLIPPIPTPHPCDYLSPVQIFLLNRDSRHQQGSRWYLWWVWDLDVLRGSLVKLALDIKNCVEHHYPMAGLCSFLGDTPASAVPTFLAPVTGFVEDHFSTDLGMRGWFQNNSSALHLLCTIFLLLLHQLHLRSSGIRLGIPDLKG